MYKGDACHHICHPAEPSEVRSREPPKLARVRHTSLSASRARANAELSESRYPGDCPWPPTFTACETRNATARFQVVSLKRVGLFTGPRDERAPDGSWLLHQRCPRVAQRDATFGRGGFTRPFNASACCQSHRLHCPCTPETTSPTHALTLDQNGETTRCVTRGYQDDVWARGRSSVFGKARGLAASRVPSLSKTFPFSCSVAQPTGLLLTSCAPLSQIVEKQCTSSFHSLWSQRGSKA
jgi:hypothetical protein